MSDRTEEIDMSKWHLRFGVTPNCNFRCTYCNPDGYEKKPILSTEEVVEILRAAILNGITRVHWTGGEPTLRKDFTDLVKAAKDAGFTSQIVTTNGYRLHKIMDECVENGLTRVIVSLDTLDPERFKELTGVACFDAVVEGLEATVQKLDSLTKISAVTMRSTLPELADIVAYAQDVNSRGYRGRLAVKLNQFFPSNPAQLKKEGQDYWRGEFVSEEEILTALADIGPLQQISRKTIEGDNPSYNYYLVGDTGVHVGVLALFSRNYPCGRCHKLRIQPTGEVSICLNLTNMPSLARKSLDEKSQILEDMIEYRERGIDQDLPNRRHYRAQLGELRFGKLGESVPMEHFYKLVCAE